MSDLHAEYREFLRRAAEVGLTRPTGLTPREHERLLLRSEVLPGPEVSLLREIIEDDVYGADRSRRDEGIALLRALTDRMRSLPVVSRERRETILEDIPLGSSPFRRVLPQIIGLFLASMLLIVPLLLGVRGGWGMGNSSPKPTGGHVEGVTPTSARSEYEAIRAARGLWQRGIPDPTIVDVEMPDYQDDTAAPGSFQLDASTGTDHSFRNWREPFTPPLSVRHRTMVYDTIDSRFRFGINDQVLVPMSKPLPTQTRTYTVDTRIWLKKGSPVPVPSPTPDAVVVSVQSPPNARVTFAKDQADGLRAISNRSGRFRLIYKLKALDGYHWAPLPKTPTNTLALSPMPLPANVRADAQVVLAKVGQVPGPTYEQTVRRLQAWCNGFVIAPIKASERKKNVFLTVALSRKGCCRHRATTFVILANAAGIPARLVTNEIHAFAEVQFPDGSWRAVDFRIGEGGSGPWEYLVTYENELNVPKVISLALILCMCTTLGLMSALRHRHSGRMPVLESEERWTRTMRRTQRDQGREEETMTLLWLVDHARDRLAKRFDVDLTDDDSLEMALHRDGVDGLVRSQAVHLLRDAGDLDADELASLTRRRELYWCVKNVLRWLDGRQIFDRNPV